MSKTKVIILLLFLLISLVFALKWGDIIEAVDKAYKTVGLKTPSYILTIVEKESGFGKNLGRNLGSKEKNLEACVKYCDYLRNQDPPVNGTECYSIEARAQWCNNQYSALEKITSNLGLDINKVPFSPDFGIGYTQFQPTTWLQYKELKNKNPWDLEDSLYAAALKLKYDGIHDDPLKAVKRYNPDKEYIKDYFDKLGIWDQILDDTIFVYDCSSNDFSCALSAIKTNYPECTENNWSIKKKKECIKTKVAEQKEKKLAELEMRKRFLEMSIKTMAIKYVNSTSAILTYKSPTEVKENKNLISENKNQASLENRTQNQISKQNLVTSNKNATFYFYEVYKKPKEQSKVKENQSKLTNFLNEISKTLTTSTKILSTSTQKASDKDVSQNSVKQINNNQPVTLGYGNGGSSNSNQRRDPCDDYKNRSYPKIIINEIQFETSEDTKDEFIELYNPNNEEIDLTCWRLEKYTADKRGSNTDNSDKQPITLIPSSKFKGKIKPNGYFLITSSSSKEKYQGDLAYAESYSIANNNVIILRKPNGEISDLVGYGSDKEKIYQYETSPFVFERLENKSIQRKNFQDTDNNSKDFWLRKPSPKNSSITELPRKDFIDLSEITIQNFNVVSTSTEGGYFLNISFNEPTATFTTSTNNYSYELLISTSTTNLHGSKTDLRGYTLVDFGSSSTLPLPKFDGSTTSLSFEITKCPTTSTNYYFTLFIKDNLDEENKSNFATSSISLPEDLCNPEEPVTMTAKILISEVYIREGTSTNEYIELYNPNSFEVNLSGWNLIKVNREGKETFVFSTSTKSRYKFKGIIKPFGYFLLANANNNLEEEYNIKPDVVYKRDIDLAKNNAIKLIDPLGNVVDLVSWGSFDDKLILVRKAGIESTKESMKNEEKYFGNSYDNEENLNEFIEFDENEPQNSLSEIEIPPDFLTEVSFNVTGQKISIQFRSPYRIDGSNTYYEIRKNSEEKLEIDLPQVLPYGKKENIEFNACFYDLKNGDKITLVLLNGEIVKNAYEFEINNLNCEVFSFTSESSSYRWGRNFRGLNSYVEKIAQELKIDKEVYVKKVRIKMSKEAHTPGDYIHLSIWKEGLESGNFITSTKVSESIIPRLWESQWIDFNFENKIKLEPGSYFFVFSTEKVYTETLNFYYTPVGYTRDKNNKAWNFIPVNGGWGYKIHPPNFDLYDSLVIIIE